jgi:DNA-directed RNA polymerase specialized sigma24 family protein
LRLVVAEPGLSYIEISLALGIPVGSIGPTRGRCLSHLRGLLEERG